MTTAPHIDTHLDLKGLEAMAEHIAKKLPEAKVVLALREMVVEVAPTQVEAAIKLLRDDKKLQFTQLIDICGVDYMGAQHTHPTRFAVVYHLLSMTHNQRVRVKCHVAGPQLAVPTVTGLFAAAGWYERETYDMYGITFTGHPDLRRILTDYDFVGFPLRKDFPLEGHVEVYYDATEKRVAYKPVDLPQEFRRFDKVSDWDGLTGNKGLADADNTFGQSAFNPREFK